ncbi:MAG: sensor histidine kinase [Bacteroidales bacterium]|nr:sensor histidine kinase [Bacteroidales bacterium]
MVIKIALVIAIVLQLFAAITAISLIKRTKYNISWILLSLALLLMAGRRIFELIPLMSKDEESVVVTAGNWIGVAISILVATGIIFIKKIFKYLERIENFRARTESRILSTIITTEEKERRRFAKDLHDGLGPLLSSIKMSISSLSQKKQKEQDIKVIGNMEEMVNEALDSIKEISNNLSPHILDNFGLLSAVKSFAQQVSISKAIDIDVNSNLKDKRFDRNVEVILYRVICELISNTVKHASAKTINVDLFQKENKVNLYYFDDGIGFDLDEVMSKEYDGMGIPNILSRIKSINGTINVEREKNKGVHISIEVKL